MAAEAPPAGKRAFRAFARGIALPGSGAARSAQRRLLELPELDGVRTVALYAALPGEVPTAAVASRLARRGVQLAFPRVEGRALQLCAVADPAELGPGYRGVPEPPARARAVPAQSVDLFVVPGMLFDRRGRRLGRGEGFYDRLLADAREDALRVGLCYADRVMDELPDSAWDAERDVAMHVVVTERDVFRPGASEDGR